MLGYIGVEVPGLKPGEFFSDVFCAHFFLLLSDGYLDRAFFHMFGFALYLLS